MRKTEYRTLYTQLSAMLNDNTFPPGELLPSENELCRKLRVSRTTVRKALAMLEGEQRIHRRPGLGTFAGVPPHVEQPQQKPLVIGMDIPSRFQNPYHCKLLWNLQEAAYALNCILKPMPAQELLAGSACDGAFFSQLPPFCYPEAARLGAAKPILLFNRITDHPGLAYVAVDYQTTSCRVVGRILANGFKRIGLVGCGPSAGQEKYADHSREAGYRQAFRNNGLPIQENWICSLTPGGDFTTLAERIVREKLEVLFLTGETFFQQTVAACELAAKQIKRFPAIVCFDDVQDSEFFGRYPITSIRMPLPGMCRAALNYLAESVRIGARPPIRQIFSAQIVNNELSPLLDLPDQS